MKQPLYLLLFALLVACGTPKKRGDHLPLAEEQPPLEQSAQPERLLFRLPLPPADAEPEQQRLFLRDHFWDNLPFADTTLLDRLDSLELLQAYCAYVGQILTETDTAAMRHLMERADTSRPLFQRLYDLSELLLYDPNSPIRSDELYIPVLEQAIASDHYTPEQKLPMSYTLALVSQNRVGQRANDLRYTLYDGSSSTLYRLKAPYTLLFISNPGCPLCRTIRSHLSDSPLVSEMVERGELEVLMIYPDEDLKEWYAHRSEIPASWINAYDKGCAIRKGRTYDLKAIPSLYLLDSQKRVLLKDVVDVGRIEYRLLTSD